MKAGDIWNCPLCGRKYPRENIVEIMAHLWSCRGGIMSEIELSDETQRKLASCCYAHLKDNPDVESIFPAMDRAERKWMERKRSKKGRAGRMTNERRK